MNNLAILSRRLYVYELYTRGLSAPEIKSIAAKAHGCHTRTIARDLNTMEEWMPEISQIRLDADKVTSDVVAKLLISQKALLNLGETADTSASRVRAYNALINSLSLQTEFLFKSGLLQRVSDETVIKHEWNLRDALNQYGPVILEAIETDLEHQSRREARPDSEQPVVPEEEPEG